MTQKQIYFVRVKDKTGELHDGHWFRVKLKDGTEQWDTKDEAVAALHKAQKNNGELMGFVDDDWVATTPKIKIDDWLTGVVPIARVPAKYREAYRDTLTRAAMAAKEYGQKIHVNSSFRDASEQLHAYDLYIHHNGPIAAKPGTSMHEKGLALDVPNLRTTPKLLAAFKKHGLIDDVATEKWHATNHGYRA